jgi:hypothetical protein
MRVPRLNPDSAFLYAVTCPAERRIALPARNAALVSSTSIRLGKHVFTRLRDDQGLPKNNACRPTENGRKQMYIARKLIVLFASASLGIGAMAPAFAQNDMAAGGNAAATGASAAKPTKAQRKQARKEARAKKNAELKKLEDAGYQPGRPNDLNYPQDLQNAQKKAGIGQGASQ